MHGTRADQLKLFRYIAGVEVRALRASFNEHIVDHKE